MPILKTYYLLQFSYWLQQALVMVAGLEKKREDYVELILHVGSNSFDLSSLKIADSIFDEIVAYHHHMAGRSILQYQYDPDWNSHFRLHVSFVFCFSANRIVDAIVVFI